MHSAAASTPPTGLRVALVHDWLVRLRGGEKVLDHLVELFPQADIYSLIYVPGRTTPRIDARRHVVSPLSFLPGIAGYYRAVAPFLAPSAIERFRLDGYDLVISSSHSFAKGVRVPPGVPHLCYCHTPIRYAWAQQDAYLGTGLKRRLAQPMVDRLRAWDRRTSTPQRITKVLANSHYIAGRIREAWQREATVVYPGVDADRFAAPPGRAREAFFLIVGGFVHYKAERLAIDAFRSIPDATLVLAGDGPTRPALAADAPPNVRFLGRVDDAALTDLYRRCAALIYPQEEDFGLVAVEAQAAGAPVIAFGRGGATETVIPLEAAGTQAATGVFFHEQTPAALADAVRRLREARTAFVPGAIEANARRFSIERFRAGIRAAVAELV